jgi:hypothetical protein
MARDIGLQRGRVPEGRTGRIWAVSFGCLAAIIAMLSTPSIASAVSPLGRFVFTGEAYGTSAKLVNGIVVSGPTAVVGLGCTDEANISKSNSVLSVNAAPLLVSGTVTTSATTSASTTVIQSQTTAATQTLNLLNGLITADAVQAVSTTTFDANGFHTSGQGSSLVNLVVGGSSITVAPAPNTKIPLPGLGSVVLNEQKSTAGPSGASLTVNMIHVFVTSPNSIASVGTQIIVSHAKSDLEGPVGGTLDGHAYGTSASIGSVVRSGPTAQVGVGCLGTDGNVRTNEVATATIPNVATVGTVVDTAQGSISPTASSETTSTVESVDLLSGLVSATVVKADAHASSDGTTAAFSDSGSNLVSLAVAGHPEITASVAPNTQISILGVGSLYLHRVITQPNSIEVRMIELIISSANTLGLPPGLDVRIAVAEASVH